MSNVLYFIFLYDFVIIYNDIVLNNFEVNICDQTSRAIFLRSSSTTVHFYSTIIFCHISTVGPLFETVDIFGRTNHLFLFFKQKQLNLI